jgi:hypothetical protein
MTEPVPYRPLPPRGEGNFIRPRAEAAAPRRAPRAISAATSADRAA